MCTDNTKLTNENEIVCACDTILHTFGQKKEHFKY